MLVPRAHFCKKVTQWHNGRSRRFLFNTISSFFRGEYGGPWRLPLHRATPRKAKSGSGYTLQVLVTGATTLSRVRALPACGWQALLSLPRQGHYLKI